MVKRRIRKVKVEERNSGRGILHKLFGVAVAACFVLGGFFAVNGITGYSIAGTVANNSNALGMIFFIFGVIGLYELLRSK